MGLKENINTLLNSAFETHNHLFLIDLSVNDAGKINVVLDGDKGVNLQDCIEINKIIDNYLEAESLDNGVEVASCGATSPMNFVRQYVKNIGRKVKVVKTDKQIIEAELVNADDEGAFLKWESREPKKIGKGKETIVNEVKIPYSEIKESTVIISF
jgi:ribosome maturation factor RimP